MDDYILNLIHAIQLAEPQNKVELNETHISWVLLTEKHAYKIKKPVNFGFLDFSSLQKRKFYCQEELRLNSRLTPDIYLSVIPITGSIDKPSLNSHGEVIDYAVKMNRFPTNSELSHIVEKKQLSNLHIDQLTEIIADFHQKIDKSTPKIQWGTAESAHRSTLITFDNLLNNLIDQKTVSRVIHIQDWVKQTFVQYKDTFKQRHDKGFIRECHGDLHLNNIALIDDKIILFDGIEFSESLRWIDVMSEIAFLMMDLQHQDLKAMAYRFLNAYLEHTGDYQGLRLLRYYLVYRSIVRAMVAALRFNQTEVSSDEYKNLTSEVDAYISLAETYIHEVYTQKNKPSENEPVLILCHGLSASGKSTISQTILENLPAIRLRSDVERKRLFGLGKLQGSHSGVGKNIYNNDATIQTYDILKQLSYSILKFGYNVIIDATFLSQSQRSEFFHLAIETQSRFTILDFIAPEEILRERIKKRSENSKEVSEADINVLENQLKRQEPLTRKELSFTYKIDTLQTFDFYTFQSYFNELLAGE